MSSKGDGTHNALHKQQRLAPPDGPLKANPISHKKGGGTVNKGSNAITDLVVYSFLVGGILVLTKPGSQGPQFVKALTGGYAKIVQATTGQATTA